MSNYKDKKRNLIERLNSGPVICAEGFLFEIEKRGYMASGEFVPMVSLDHPEVLENLHRDFQHAGSDIVQAFTYNGHREKMRVIGKEELLEPLNSSALKILLTRRLLTTALVGGFFLEIISTKNWVFNHIVHLTFSRSTKKEQ